VRIEIWLVRSWQLRVGERTSFHASVAKGITNLEIAKHVMEAQPKVKTMSIKGQR
jgi:hypothetical protein